MPPHIAEARAAGTQAIVLAAGAGRRFGGGKLLAPFRSRPLVCWAVEAALASCVEGVTVVVGARGAEIAALLALHAGERLRVVQCRDWGEGIAASLRCGIEALPDGTRAALLLLGDMPLVSPGLADRVLTRVLDGAPAALPLCDGQPGHPVAVSHELFTALARLNGDRGARSLLEGLDGVVTIATADGGCVRDVDTRDDLAALARQGWPGGVAGC
ncbi:MAG: nucleotidyltransferase family protein [Porphyrobacter sp.]|nr:nucleotidyltransferase family protein [Porphyrobacter sp.]